MKEPCEIFPSGLPLEPMDIFLTFMQTLTMRYEMSSEFSWPYLAQ